MSVVPEKSGTTLFNFHALAGRWGQGIGRGGKRRRPPYEGKNIARRMRKNVACRMGEKRLFAKEQDASGGAGPPDAAGNRVAYSVLPPSR